MNIPTAVNVVYGQERGVGDPANGTLATVMGQNEIPMFHSECRVMLSFLLWMPSVILGAVHVTLLAVK